MAYSDNFPATRPVFMADFANGGKIDPRATFSRPDSPINGSNAPASAVHFWSNEKHLSSENLLTHSNDISSAYGKNGLTETGGQTAPDGGTDAYKLTEDSATGFHRIYYASPVLSSGSLTVSCYVKYIGRQWVYLRLRDSGAAYRHVWFDVQNGTKGTEETNMTGSITSSGGGYYKLTATVSSVHATSADVRIGGANADGNTQYAGSGSDAFAVWGIQASTTGETVLNETSGSVHRSYAPTLKSVGTAGAARFEYDPETNVSRGILIESQAANLYGNSLDMTGTAGTRTNIDSNVTVGPTGELTADALRLNGSNSNTHYREYSFTAAASTTYTFSVYLKAAGLSHAAIRSNNLFATEYVYFNLSNGTVEGSPSMSNSMTSVGNGWYRCSVTATTTGSGAASFVIYITDSAASTIVSTGDSYRAILGQAIQIEAGSHPSSFIETSGGTTATRAADSLSAAIADIGYSGNNGTLLIEVDGGYGSYPSAVSLHDGAGYERVLISRDSLTADNSTDFYAFVGDKSGTSSTLNLSGSGSASKVAVSFATNDFAATAGGGTVVTSTSGVSPAAYLTTLQIGNQIASNPWNGHVKRVALYNEALSDTNLQALTS